MKLYEIHIQIQWDEGGLRLLFVLPTVKYANIILLHSSCAICSVSLRRWGDGISLAAQNVFADLVWDGNSAPVKPSFCILSQDCTNAFLLSFSIFNVLISCLCHVYQTARWDSRVRPPVRNLDWLRRKWGKEGRELAENVVTLTDKTGETHKAAGGIFRKSKTCRGPVGVPGVGEIKGERVPEFVKTEFWLFSVQNRRNHTGLQFLKASTGIMLVLKKKKKKRYSNGQKIHNSATTHICTTQTESEPSQPIKVITGGRAVKGRRSTGS